ncbi:hypothetical protein H6A18_03470 [Collinsella tanakaei]|uniref:hypothetical protein n=1 Tax=Collinsella tanakaei TaxID=626935 RepID=UPI00195E674C|nr:hypothetical protein [Collinsella tanakaei]MBM6755586.1 hypothetical protein [Collinsella tanakaei]
MDIKALTDQVTGALSNSPEAIKDFISDPASAIEGITGEHLEGADLSGVVDSIKQTVTGGGFELPEGLDLSGLAENLGGIAGGLTEGLGGVLENTPLSGIAEGLGGLFGKKR